MLALQKVLARLQLLARTGFCGDYTVTFKHGVPVTMRCNEVEVPDELSSHGELTKAKGRAA